MSIIKNAISSIFTKQHIKKNIASNTFKSLESHYLPYSCLVAPNVIITKNGDLLQIIEIILDDFKLNQENGLRSAIRNAINDKIDDTCYTLWIHTVKQQRQINETTDLLNKKDAFIEKITEEYKIIQNQINNYNISVYITICKKNINRNQSILQQIQGFISYSKDKLDNKIIEINQYTTALANEIKLYNPNILGISENNGTYYSDMIKALSVIINLDDRTYPLEERDISRMLNSSKYLFGNRVVAIQKKNELLFSTSFSLKEIPIIPITVVADILGIHTDIVITEYVSFIDKKVASSYFQEQINLTKYSNNKRFAQLVDIDFLDNDDTGNRYCKSSISFTVFAKNALLLRDVVNAMSNMFSKYGIIAIMEDISLERNYYALMPANFSFIHRLSIHNAKEVGMFSYSYLPKVQDSSMFLNNKPLFTLGTLKYNPVLFGVLKQDSNILLCGPKNCGKTVFSNFIASQMMSNGDDIELCIIETASKSRSFIESINGSWYRVSLERDKHTATFNPFETAKYSNDSYLMDFFSMLIITANAVISTSITDQINRIIMHIKEKFKDGKKFAIHDIRSAFINTDIEREIQLWHSVGKYYHLFDHRENFQINNNKICFYIDETIQQNQAVMANIVNHIINTVVNTPITNGKKRVIIIDEPFMLFSHIFFKNLIDKLIDNANKNGVILIFKISDLSFESATLVDFSSLVTSAKTQVHFANKDADENYGRIFKLKKFEYLAIQTLKKYKHSLLLKKIDDVMSCHFDMSYFRKTLSLLSDNDDIRTKILSLKEMLQTDNANRWIPAFYTNNDIIQHENAKSVAKEINIIHEAERVLNN